MLRSLRFLSLALTLALPALGSQPAMKEWAFLIFMDGNNNLAQYTDLNIKQLETVGSTADVDVIVQWAKVGNDKTYRLKVEKSTDASKVTSPMIETLPRVDMGDYKQLIEFVKWSVERYPAKHYIVSLWDHGSGWKLNRKQGFRDVSHDDYSGHAIKTEELGVAMAEIKKIIGHNVDLLTIDACLMQMVEISSEVADSVDYTVASEELEPGLGWPYDKFFARLAAKPTASAAEVGSYLVEEYPKYLSTDSVTLSVLHAGGLPKVWAALKNLGTALLRVEDENMLPLRAITSSAFAFYHRDYVDMIDWAMKAQSFKATGFDGALVDAFVRATKEVVTANAGTGKMAPAQGVSFWIPDTKGAFDPYKARYANLRFARETGWDKVLERMLTLPVCKRFKNGQWASEVLGFSSQYGESGWSAKQALGVCDTATYGDQQTAWAPKTADGDEEFLSLAFATPVHSTGVVIRESSGAGFVTKIEAIDDKGVAHEVWNGEDKSTPGIISDLQIDWNKTDYLTKGLKIAVTTKKSPGTWKEIDSVQLLAD